MGGWASLVDSHDWWISVVIARPAHVRGAEGLCVESAAADSPGFTPSMRCLSMVLIVR